MEHRAVSIPLTRIARIENYVNDAGQSLAEIMAEQGADYGLNGVLWDLDSGEFCCHLKREGRVLQAPPYRVRGYVWDTGADIRMEQLPDLSRGETDHPARNYLACTPLIAEGTPLDPLTYDPGQGGRRGRAAVGMKAGRLCLYCARDGGGEARTPEQLRDLLASFGWESAVMLDGGGSAQCDFAGQRIRSGRTVRHVLLVYLKRPETKKPAITLHAFSRSRDGEKQLTRNLRVREFACRDGSDPIFIAEELWKLVQAIRDHFGRRVHITSGYRTPDHNRKIGGKARSQHLYGCAADLTVEGVDPDTVADYARTLMPDRGGVGRYRTFTHVDVRLTRADW